jgi:hypothetical protein
MIKIYKNMISISKNIPKIVFLKILFLKIFYYGRDGSQKNRKKKIKVIMNTGTHIIYFFFIIIKNTKKYTSEYVKIKINIISNLQ